MTKILDGKVAVVTGGAGGIGAAISQGLADAGCSVVVGFNRSRLPAQVLASSLPGGEAKHEAMWAPVTNSDALKSLAEQVRDRYGKCDVLVNCAGTTRFVPHADMDALDDALIDEILTTNIRGPFAATRAFRSLLERTAVDGSTSVVINISSIAAVSAMGSNVIYCASKAAVDNMTKSLARALAPKIRVISVSPGLSDTEFVKSMDQAWRNEQADRTPLKRLAYPSEVAEAVISAAVHLTFSTGTVIAVDGGRQLA
jgi:3-oxoacyl-[acyl-carrier protein] reductase